MQRLQRSRLQKLCGPRSSISLPSAKFGACEEMSQQITHGVSSFFICSGLWGYVWPVTSMHLLQMLAYIIPGNIYYYYYFLQYSNNNQATKQYFSIQNWEKPQNYTTGSAKVSKGSHVYSYSSSQKSRSLVFKFCVKLRDTDFSKTTQGLYNGTNLHTIHIFRYFCSNCGFRTTE